MIPFDACSVSRDKLLAMLRREQQLRDSRETQDLYDYYHKRGECSPDTVEIDIQRKVLCEFGFSCADSSVSEYWQVYNVWKDHIEKDEELRNSVVYLNRHLFRARCSKWEITPLMQRCMTLIPEESCLSCR